jgi:hypothetical protein
MRFLQQADDLSAHQTLSASELIHLLISFFP